MNMKVLNLYAGIGGNRKLWTDVEVTAVEWDPKIAGIYRDFFPDDRVLVEDAHQYLLDHFKEYDFIWSSPPCPTHSHLNYTHHARGLIRYPDMRLYEEIVFLQTFYDGLYCVENVRSYYDPLVKPFYRGRHYLWVNFYITPFKREAFGWDVANAGGRSPRLRNQEYVKKLEERHGFKVNGGVEFRIQVLRNCVDPLLGQHILNCVRGNTQKTLAESIGS